MSEEKFDRRSQYWFGLKDKGGYIHRERLRNQGYAPDVFDGRPVIGIANTWSELNPCNGSLDDVAEAVKRGVWEAGGFPLEFPAMSLSESLQRPTTMLYRNMLAMEVEELIRSHPLDGVVLLGNFLARQCILQKSHNITNFFIRLNKRNCIPFFNWEFINWRNILYPCVID